jgi:Txe/YoeB family toxin of Txe-Axe toxin-antitoxin module
VEVIYSEKAQKDREFWKKSRNKAIMNKISALIQDIHLHPFEGIGEALNTNFRGSCREELIKNTELHSKLSMKTRLKF